MELAALFFLTFVGTVVWVLNPEAAAVVSVTGRSLRPLDVAVVAALGQAGAQGLLWVGGDRIRAIWPWFNRQCETARTRWGLQLSRSTVPVALSSGLLGVPPSSATAVLSPGLGLRAALVLPILFVTRIIRFAVVCLAAAELVAR
jgi:membrane protein YqaA with SNARE-associated domain